MVEIAIRPATKDDAALILHLIKELAIYEKAEQEVIATSEDIRQSLFAENSTAHGLICTIDDKPIGYAVYFFNYSTWLGKPGLYLEDLYVTSECRGQGAGKLLLKHLANIALDKGCGRFEWSVLDWNEPAIQFYQSIGAKPQNEWVAYRLVGAALKAFAHS
ncbi:GNAT family N-acetyltransferase [Candidatus Endobugula sertula]|uniref:GNAT family N-acetyltransferase n=1 Tax=Candidatus Endobugula sertula TaxID=62101 RepID=A0A1D2QNM1_9GAMM|nr:GNAT family N-acetyltransferase [Candidatus Endobugula sertula]